jgi:hypothetical protein
MIILAQKTIEEAEGETYEILIIVMDKSNNFRFF